MPDRLQTFDYEPVVGLPRPPLEEEERADAFGPEPAGDPEPERTGDDFGRTRPGGVSSRPGGVNSRPRGTGKLSAKWSRLLHGERWGAPRGHAASFAGLLAFILVLYFRPQDYFPWLQSAYIAFVPAVLTLLAYLPSQLAAEGTLTARPREVNLALLLMLSALISVPLAVSPSVAFSAFWENCLKSVLTFVIIVNVVRTEGRLRVMLYLAVAVTVLLCLFAINDYRNGTLVAEGYRVVGRSSAGMFENTNDLAVQLVTVLPIMVALGLGGRGLLRKLVFGACAALTLVVIVLTFSRGASLALLASGVFMAWKLGRRSRLTVFAALGLVAVLFMALAPGEYWERLASIVNPSLDRLGSAQARSGLLAHALISAVANPVFGLGIGNFPLVSERGLVTHNAYMQVAAEMGFAGAVIYAMFVVAPLRRLRLIEEETFEERRASRFYHLSVGLQTSIVAYMVSSFFVSVAFYLYIYFLVGYAVCLRRIYCDATETRGENSSGGRASNAPTEVWGDD
ncbi:MAG TPA: O-antigen ligase family protein [Pyrinomonadaceae bacterium]|nr:O-antigen ligase family protein [Pyrinomonadaceae bacterium]